MATWVLGPLRIGEGVARKVGLFGGVAAVAGGLVLGVVTAVDPGEAFAAPPPAPAQTAPPLPGPSTPAPGAAAAGATKPAPRAPLHQLLAAIVKRRRSALAAAVAARPAQRMIIGRLTALGSGGATVRTASGEMVNVTTNAQTKLPARRAQVGDQVVVMGVPAGNGSYLAKAVLLRPAPVRPAVRQTRAQVAKALLKRLAAQHPANDPRGTAPA